MDDRARRNMLNAAMTAPYLAREEEHDLAMRWKNQNDKKAMHKIAIAHMRLVVSMAGRFRHFGLPLGDLVQEGNIGLLEATKRFDPERDIRFSTYASWWIRASMQDFILRNWSIVRGGTSSAQKALFFNLRRLKARIAREGQDVDLERFHADVSERLGIAVADVAAMDARLSHSDSSLNAPVAMDGQMTMERMDLLVCENPLPDEMAEVTIDEERRLKWLTAAMAKLNARELKIIRERRLVDEAATLEVLGKTLGISKERVRQIEGRAMEKLRTALTGSLPVSA